VENLFSSNLMMDIDDMTFGPQILRISINSIVYPRAILILAAITS